MTNLDRLLSKIQNAAQASAAETGLLSPLPLAHSKELEAELPRLRQHVGPRPWFQWIEQNHPRE